MNLLNLIYLTKWWGCFYSVLRESKETYNYDWTRFPNPTIDHTEWKRSTNQKILIHFIADSTNLSKLLINLLLHFSSQLNHYLQLKSIFTLICSHNLIWEIIKLLLIAWASTQHLSMHVYIFIYLFLNNNWSMFSSDIVSACCQLIFYLKVFLLSSTSSCSLEKSLIIMFLPLNGVTTSMVMSLY